MTAVRPLHALTAYCLALVLGLILLVLGEALGGVASALGRVGGMQIGSLLAIVLVVILGSLGWRHSLGLYACHHRAVAGSLLIGLALSLLIAATLAHLYRLGEAEEHARAVDEVLRETTQRIGPLGLAMVVVILAPLAEELLFRGLILRGMLARFPPWAAILISTALFAMLHGHPVHATITAVLGLACALLVIHGRSIWPAIALHCAYNGTTLGLDHLGFSEPLSLWTIPPALTIMVIGVFLIRRQQSGKPG
ncbi:CPBP family intramembrane glutamic endopeptidase [Natronospira bacteriovora]|uniref:CPBP family intramembrane glutamic endopeptidase n=1 Tax=Natronospira bacteriovora TaxID=3069753 RepID=A0ABU0W3Y3_9GAMM|nr:CPBP family intramembrane glutamic endopeptidase [Natronospira sp. AB-CW4]MDQ2068701.1 CPBP family intramembrane glutamic endopeptidase [Natronospira sp. AB-CW4]